MAAEFKRAQDTIKDLGKENKTLAANVARKNTLLREHLNGVDKLNTNYNDMKDIPSKK